MALVDVIKSSINSIRQISEHVEGSILYIDAGCTESFQFIGAFPLLMDLGVHTVCSLENVCPLDTVVDWKTNVDPAMKVVVITSRLLSDAHRYILRCLRTHQNVQHCTVFTSISEVAHSVYPDSPLGPDAFREYESLLVQDYHELVKKEEAKYKQTIDTHSSESLTFQDEGWSKLNFGEEEISHAEAGSSARNPHKYSVGHMEYLGRRLTVSVHHFPMILCPLSPRVFVLPSEGSVAEAHLSAEREDSLNPGLPPLSSGMPYDGDDAPPGATLTAHFIYHLAAKMDLKLEVFSLGDLSKTVGKILTDMSSLYDVGRRKRSAGLLLIDRTFDLLTPCRHGDSLVDRIFSSLPRRERTFYTQMKSSQRQLKDDFSNVQRSPLDVRIPLAKILSEGDSKIDSFRLLENINYFLRGWGSSEPTCATVDSAGICDDVNNENLLQSDIEILHGSLISSENFHGTPYLETILDMSTKDGTILVKKWLQEVLRREKIAMNVKTRPGFSIKSELQLMIKALAKSQPSLLRNKGLIQLAAAAVLALDESHSARWDAFISAENILTISAAGDTSQSLAAQIGDLINRSTLVGLQQKNGKAGASQGLLSLQDVLLLAMIGYILAGENFPTSGSDGPFSWQEEHLLKEAIVDAVLENPSIPKLKFLHGLTEELEANLKRNKSNETKNELSNPVDIDDFDDDQWGVWGDEDADSSTDKEQVYDDMQLKLELRHRMDNFFKFLHKLSRLKRSISPSTLTLDSDSSGDPYASKGLLHKLLLRVLGKYDVPGLEYHSSTVGRLFKSGFGRFGLGQAKPSLADQNVILVFVLGGINCCEVREAQEALSESGRPDIELIIGGTTLLSPDNMLDMLLGNSSYI